MLLQDIKKANLEALKNKNSNARAIYSVLINKCMVLEINKREKGEELAQNTNKCDYDALRFLLPSESLGQLDREYNFTSRLKEKIGHIQDDKIMNKINSAIGISFGLEE